MTVLSSDCDPLRTLNVPSCRPGDAGPLRSTVMAFLVQMDDRRLPVTERGARVWKFAVGQVDSWGLLVWRGLRRRVVPLSVTAICCYFLGNGHAKNPSLQFSGNVRDILSAI